MEKLRDQTSVPAELELTRRLVSAKQPTVVAPFQKERVLARLAAQKRGSRPARRLRPAGVLAAIAVLGLFSVASAMIGRALWRRLHAHSAATVSSERARAATEPSSAVQPAPSSPPATAPAATAEPSEAPKHAHVHRPSRPAVEARPAKEEPAPAAPPAPAATPSPDTNDGESALLAQAIAALRRAHDPNRTLGLVDTYLAKYPHGTLLEEALALGIEAARTGSPAQARAFAQRYLALFPTGRYANEARHILSLSQ
jgi:hypothetical protein